MPVTAPDHVDGRVAIAADGVEVAATAAASTAVSERTTFDEIGTRSRLPRADGRVYRTFVGSAPGPSYAGRMRMSATT